MRKILFRGRDHAGKWHKGSLITRIEESPVPETAVPYAIHYIKGQDFVGEKYEVDPKTIGQLAYPATEEHPDIWEGDIIEDEDGCPMEVMVDLYQSAFNVIVRSDTNKIYESLDEYDIDFMFKYSQAKVVGNIHDNPELITKPFCDHAQKGQTN